MSLLLLLWLLLLWLLMILMWVEAIDGVELPSLWQTSSCLELKQTQASAKNIRKTEFVEALGSTTICVLQRQQRQDALKTTEAFDVAGVLFACTHLVSVTWKTATWKQTKTL